MRIRTLLAVVATMVTGCSGESVIGGGTEDGGLTNGGAGGTTASSGGMTPGVGTSGTGVFSGGSGSGGAYYGTTPSVNCDYATALTKTCAISSCHKQGAVPAATGLSLVPDDGLISRLKDVPATHGDTYCADISDTCAEPPAACPVGDKLIDSAAPENSWMHRKLNDPQDCGDKMPAGVPITPDQRACIESLIFGIAALP